MGSIIRPPVGATVLVVDDDQDTLEILTRTLESAGYRVLTADTGPRCLEIAGQRPVDVIVLDVMMPGMDGLVVCEKLQKDPQTRAIPIILLTAKDDVATRAAGMRLGVSEYVTKPVDIQQVIVRVRNQLHAATIRRQLDESTERLGELTTDKATH